MEMKTLLRIGLEAKLVKSWQNIWLHFIDDLKVEMLD
jgi:hypothetical protein